MKYGTKLCGRSTGRKLDEDKVTLPMILSSNFHLPVLSSEVMEGLNVEKGKKYIDGTLGGGGHTSEILERGGIVLGIDSDENAINFVRKKFNAQSSKFKIDRDVFLERGNFENLAEIAKKYGFEKVDGIVFDLGMSSFQLDKSGLGFSFRKEEPLDMRMDRNKSVKAADIINSASKEELYEIFTKYAEELHSRSIAEAIIRTRAIKPILTTRDLIRAIDEVILNERSKGKIYARIFQALRIMVNGELKALEKGLIQGLELLNKYGRFNVISFHSLEDRLVKSFYLRSQTRGLLKIISKKPIKATYSECRANPRARSAHLRIAERV